MPRARTYTDGMLREAVAASASWRATLRHLGLAGTSSSAIRSARRRADALGLDYSHFRGQRRWTREELEAVVASAQSWAEVVGGLGLSPTAGLSIVKGHARRLGLDCTHLEGKESTAAHPMPNRVDVALLRRAGPMMAAAWFTMTGCDVAWPLEPCPFDLLVRWRARTYRVQVKTTTLRTDSSWVIRLTRHHQGEAPYDVDEIDWFFLIDGDQNYYLVPVLVVGGRFLIHLAAYQQFRVRPEPMTASD